MWRGLKMKILAQQVLKTQVLIRGFLLHNDVTKDFVQIFREDNDQGKTGLKNSPEKQKIERNLNSFMGHWSNISDSPLTNATFTEIVNLRQHIQKGCLSDIPAPGCGTERNDEGLHHLLNRSMISGATRISVELAIALLTIYFIITTVPVSQCHLIGRNTFMFSFQFQFQETFLFLIRNYTGLVLTSLHQ